MFKRTMMMALAYVGLVVGAGFASGQEVLQYFVSFGTRGIWGAVLASVILAVTGLIVFQLGSYYRAKEHSAVFVQVSPPILARTFDVFITFTLFCIGLVMIAGAGSNLQQQFGLPVWVGSVLMAVLCILAGMLDVSRVTAVIGAITPFIIVFIVAAASYAIATSDANLGDLDALARTLPTALPQWTLSAVNYVAMALSLAVSMAIVMGGDQMDPKSAGRGGFIGGLTFGVLLTLSAIALLLKVGDVSAMPLPMLELVNAIHPAAGIAMAVVIFGMIFNTAVGMFYALAKRVAASRPRAFRPALVGFVLAGFASSFVGFKALVGYLYPIIGYVGIALIAILAVGWLRERPAIAKEIARRVRIRDLSHKKYDANRAFTRREEVELAREIHDSVIDDDELRTDITEEVRHELDRPSVDEP